MTWPCFPNFDSFCHARNICGWHKNDFENLQKHFLCPRGAHQCCHVLPPMGNIVGHNVAAAMSPGLAETCRAFCLTVIILTITITTIIIISSSTIINNIVVVVTTRLPSPSWLWSSLSYHHRHPYHHELRRRNYHHPDHDRGASDLEIRISIWKSRFRISQNTKSKTFFKKDFVEQWEIQNPYFKIEIRISKSKAPMIIIHRHIVVVEHSLLLSLLHCRSRCRIHLGSLCLSITCGVIRVLLTCPVKRRDRLEHVRVAAVTATTWLGSRRGSDSRLGTRLLGSDTCGFIKTNSYIRRKRRAKPGAYSLAVVVM